MDIRDFASVVATITPIKSTDGGIVTTYHVVVTNAITDPILVHALPIAFFKVGTVDHDGIVVVVVVSGVCVVVVVGPNDACVEGLAKNICSDVVGVKAHAVVARYQEIDNVRATSATRYSRPIDFFFREGFEAADATEIGKTREKFGIAAVRLIQATAQKIRKDMGSHPLVLGREKALEEIAVFVETILVGRDAFGNGEGRRRNGGFRFGSNSRCC
mmetsp:Transcript_21599/g.48564  ORF Transcript_21599/g.48564 Transcript_21599/m.48564 type:complete len:216 (-) Transcript_21599:118-765(-)